MPDVQPAKLPADYYEFGSYVNRARWLTYYAQLRILSAGSPQSVLEIGVGPGIVNAVLRARAVDVISVDINPALEPDVVADVRALPEHLLLRQWDWLLVSRVLHHIPGEEVPKVLDGLRRVNAKRVLVTVPREDLSVQVSVRRTAGRSRAFRLSGGSWLKARLRGRLIKSAPSGLWMLGGSRAFSRVEFRSLLASKFAIDDEFVLPDDPSHVFFVLEPRARA